MNHDQETYELIERYLSGDMEGEELLRFEQEIESDVELKQEVGLQRSVEGLLGDEEINQLDDQLSALRNDYANTPRQTSRKIFWFAAAAVLALIATYVGLFRGGDDINGNDLYLSYFELYPSDNIVRSGDSTQTQLNLGLEAYQAEDFDKAMKFLQPLIKTNTRARFYYAISQLANGEPEKALSLFQLIEDGSIYSDPAAWYSVLAFLKQEQVEQAIALLENMEEKARGKYQKLASELLEKLQ